MMGESEALRIWARKVFGRGSVSSPGKVRRVDLIKNVVDKPEHMY